MHQFHKNSVRDLLKVESRITELEPQLADAERAVARADKRTANEANGRLHGVKSEMEDKRRQRDEIIAAISPNLEKLAAAFDLIESLRILQAS